jgi:hypothetical protein
MIEKFNNYKKSEMDKYKDYLIGSAAQIADWEIKLKAYIEADKGINWLF